MRTYDELSVLENVKQCIIKKKEEEKIYIRGRRVTDSKNYLHTIIQPAYNGVGSVKKFVSGYKKSRFVYTVPNHVS